MSVCATAARIATHAHAMPLATRPAVTQASPILLGCRMLDGQVHSGEDQHDGGLRAERVAHERSETMSVFETSLFDYDMPAQHKHMLVTAQFSSLAWGCRQ